MNTKNLDMAILMAVPVIGMVALIALELVRAMALANGADALPPAEMLAGVICLSAVPVILLASSSATLAYWVSLVVAVLMSLFHLMHVLEHLMHKDISIAGLIIVTMAAPSLMAAVRLWCGRRSLLSKAGAE